MRLRLTMLPRLIAKIVDQRRVSLQALTACALASLMASSAHAQLQDALVYPNDPAIGSAALGESMTFSDTRPESPSNGVFVGPGGETSVLNVPSSTTPTMGKRTKYVNQPMLSQPMLPGSLLQSPSPMVQDAGIPCPCDPGCDFSYYGSAEALYFRRDYDERFTLSQFQIPPFDYEWGGRVTVGHIWDCVNGYEFVYAGPFKWTREMTVNSAGGNLQSRLATSGLPAGAISTFNNANLHRQVYQARLNNYEFNRRWWAWDVFSLLIGLRAVDYRESYGFFSQNAGGVGIYEDFTRNRMVGPQIGAEVNQPLGMRALVGFRGKAALLGNFSRNAVNLSNAGSAILGTSDSDVDVAGLFEFGTFVKYSLTPSVRLTAGYEMWYLPGVATVASQGLNIVSPGTAQKVNADDDLFLHGFSAGAQILY